MKEAFFRETNKQKHNKHNNKIAAPKTRELGYISFWVNKT